MSKLPALVALGASLMLLASTPAQSATRGAVVMRVTSVEFLEPTAECPLGRAVAPLTPVVGGPGTVTVCLQSFSFICEPSGCRQVITGTATWSLPGGDVITQVRVDERLSRDFSSAHVLWTGIVIGGTGEYAGATGRLHGVGRVEYPPDAMPRPNLVFVLVLR